MFFCPPAFCHKVTVKNKKQRNRSADARTSKRKATNQQPHVDLRHSPDPQHPPLPERPVGLPARWGLAIFGTALLIRGLYLFEMRNSVLFAVLMGDGVSYDAWAQRIIAGGWYGKEVFYQAPMYPYFLALVYGLFGPGLWPVRLVQAMIGSGSCVLLAAGATRFFDRRVGIVTGFFAAAYGPAIFFDAQIQKPVLSMLFVALLVYLLGRMRHTMHAWLAVAAGATLGGFALTRENALILVPIVAVWMALPSAAFTRRQRLRSVALLLVGVSLVLVPVGFRNLHVGGRFLLTTAQMGPNFYIGNSPEATGWYVALLPNRGDAKYEQQDATELAEQAVGRKLTPSEVSGYWMGRALDYVRSSPGPWLALMCKKTALTFGSREIIDTESIEAHCECSRVLGVFAYTLHFGVIGPMALAGMWLTRQRWRQYRVLYAMILGFAVAVAAFYVVARYRYPLAPLLMLFAAAGLVEGVTSRPHNFLIGKVFRGKELGTLAIGC